MMTLRIELPSRWMPVRCCRTRTTVRIPGARSRHWGVRGTDGRSPHLGWRVLGRPLPVDGAACDDCCGRHRRPLSWTTTDATTVTIDALGSPTFSGSGFSASVTPVVYHNLHALRRPVSDGVATASGDGDGVAGSPGRRKHALYGNAVRRCRGRSKPRSSTTAAKGRLPRHDQRQPRRGRLSQHRRRPGRASHQPAAATTWRRSGPASGSSTRSAWRPPARYDRRPRRLVRPGGTFHVEVEGVDKTGPLAVPNTGGTQTWVTITSRGGSPDGRHAGRPVGHRRGRRQRHRRQLQLGTGANRIRLSRVRSRSSLRLRV